MSWSPERVSVGDPTGSSGGGAPPVRRAGRRRNRRVSQVLRGGGPGFLRLDRLRRRRAPSPARYSDQMRPWACGNPTVVAELIDGEVVLDLGSGGGIMSFFPPGRWVPPGRLTVWT